jgi:hypothetical protein
LDGIDTAGTAVSALRAGLVLDFRSGLEEAHPLRRGRPHGHHGHPHGPKGHEHHRARESNDEAAPAQELRYQRSEKSVLKIRTLEGDIVSLRIRAGESLAVENETVTGSDEQVAETRLIAKSSTKVSLKVKGDLNPDELAAIQSVFEQAVALADEFFAGDYAAAFEAAAGLEVDAQQLAKVSLRFKVREALTYSGSGLPPVLFGPPAETPALTDDSEAASDSTIVPAAVDASAETVQPESAPIQSDAAAGSDVAVATEEAPAETDPGAADVSDTAAPTSQTGAWFSAVLGFMSQLIEAFDVAAAELDTSVPKEDGEVRLDLSLKLRLFSAVLVEIAASENPDAGKTAGSVPALVPETIEAIAAGKEPSLIDVA